MALTAYEDSLCAGCGQPKGTAYNPDADGWYEARDDVTCAACAALDRRRGEKQKVEPGSKVYVADLRPEHVQLHPWTPPSARPDDPDDGDGDPG